MKRYYFIGIGGSGMSAIAQALAASGDKISGSDRNHDRGLNTPFFDTLKSFGITILPQDGSGVTPDTDFVVVSTAIEDTVPDMQRAKELGVRVLHRAQLLAEIVNSRRGVAVGGTSGKSTVTGMAGHCLHFAGLDPSVINGGKIKNFMTENSPGNTRAGGSDLIVVESDESDGSIIHYKPEVSIITNITLDHKPIPELRALFETFISNTTGLAVLNADCPETSTLNTGGRGAPLTGSGRKTTTFSLEGRGDLNAEILSLETFKSQFKLSGLTWTLNTPGRHNIANALACVAIARHFAIPDSETQKALASFNGIARRFDVIGETNGITVIDDFGHNPDKIRATLETLALSGRRKLVFFQPHGFAPTLLMKDDLIKVFSAYLADGDILFMPEIFYAGGTASKTISAADIAAAVRANGKNVVFNPERPALAPLIAAQARPGDIITVMGARDDTLTLFCHEILALLKT